MHMLDQEDTHEKHGRSRRLDCQQWNESKSGTDRAVELKEMTQLTRKKDNLTFTGEMPTARKAF